MNLPKLGDLGVEGKKVLVRLDLDISEGGDMRLTAALPTLNYLLEKKAKIIIIGHKGRPAATKALAGKPEGINGELSLEKTSKKLSELLSKPIKFIYDIVGQEARDETEKLQEGEVMCLENLRFDSREEANDEGFAKSLAGLGDCYVNDAFASSHREHASIVGIPKYLPRAAGLRLEREIETLGKDFDKPVVVLISGIKKDKVEMAEKLSEIYDTVLVGGRLPEYFGDRALESVQTQTGKLIIGNLIMDKEDISLNTIKRFEIEIEKARTIILAGVLGKYEDSGHMQGTKEVFTAVAKSNAFKIAGGGDTIAALNSLSLSQNFQWISTGGGAMIEFLINKTLPGIKVFLGSQNDINNNKISEIREAIGIFLKEMLVHRKISIDELQLYSEKIVDLLPEGLDQNSLDQNILVLNTEIPILKPVTLKLMSNFSKLTLNV